MCCALHSHGARQLLARPEPRQQPAGRAHTTAPALHGACTPPCAQGPRYPRPGQAHCVGHGLRPGVVTAHAGRPGRGLNSRRRCNLYPQAPPQWTLVCPVFNFSGEQHAHHCLASRRTYHRDHFADAVRSFLSYRPPAASLPLPVLQYTLQDTAPKKPPAPRRGFLLLGKANGGFGSAARPGRHGTAKPGAAALRAAVVQPPQPGAMTARALV